MVVSFFSDLLFLFLSYVCCRCVLVVVFAWLRFPLVVLFVVVGVSFAVLFGFDFVAVFVFWAFWGEVFFFCVVLLLMSMSLFLGCLLLFCLLYVCCYCCVGFVLCRAC